ncbi:MAG: hypothetical protein KF703_15605, partial [Actinobacteria bacterium]|nr:hypothetical protein [Actinomycetota bacterium]
VGDQDGDGITDLAAPSQPDGFGDTLVYSGADLTAPGPGATADVDPFLELDGLLVGRIPFDAGPPTLVTAEDTSVIAHQDPPVELTVLGSGVPLPYVSQTTTGASGVVDGDVTWLVLGHGDRSGNLVWGWKLTDLCNTTPPAPRPTVPEPTTPGAPAAAPVGGRASYTG